MDMTNNPMVPIASKYQTMPVRSSRPIRNLSALALGTTVAPACGVFGAPMLWKRGIHR